MKNLTATATVEIPKTVALGPADGPCPKCQGKLGPVPQPEGSPIPLQQWQEERKGFVQCQGCKENYFVENGQLQGSPAEHHFLAAG